MKTFALRFSIRQLPDNPHRFQFAPSAWAIGFAVAQTVEEAVAMGRFYMLRHHWVVESVEDAFETNQAHWEGPGKPLQTFLEAQKHGLAFEIAGGPPHAAG